MRSEISLDLARVARTAGLKLSQVEQTFALLEDGNTVPFITRYRKDQTGGLDEQKIRTIEAEVGKLRLLGERKQTILRSIESQGKLAPKLAELIRAVDSIKELEDLYLPFKPKKQTRATVARQRGLEPLAREILAGATICADLDARAGDFVNPDRQVDTVADALLGAGHILAEAFSERVDLRRQIRGVYRKTGELVSIRSGGDEKSAKGFRDYFDYREPIAEVPPHRVLAINRGERAKVLRVRVEGGVEAIQRIAELRVLRPDHPHREYLCGCLRDALDRLILPSLEREVRRELTEKAERHAVEVFAKNLRHLLLQPPIRGKRVLALDPGFKSGCKVAALDEFGNLIEHDVVHLVGSEQRQEAGRSRLVELISQHTISVVAIGNGTACRETEEVVAPLISERLPDRNVSYVIVNEAGASVYSTSEVGREELPEYDATVRGAVSIGRRLQDPLSELVKIDAANIGVGMYQHDVKAKHLRSSLGDVVESCVNYVGVDVNTASPALLRFVSGLNGLTARRVFEYRQQNGPFRNRLQLMNVPGMGEATFVQAAGFLKVADGDQPLDATWIHPESYRIAETVLERIGCRVSDLTAGKAAQQISASASKIDLSSLSEELSVGRMTLDDIIANLSRPGRDPREDLPPPIFRKDIVKLEDLEVGMELTGSVLNVVDFGAFVDIGLHDSGLVHVSQMSNQFVRDPHQVVAVGDNVKVWVTGIDKNRRRISLTMIRPGGKSERRSRKKKSRGGKPTASWSPDTAAQAHLSKPPQSSEDAGKPAEMEVAPEEKRPSGTQPPAEAEVRPDAPPDTTEQG